MLDKVLLNKALAMTPLYLKQQMNYVRQFMLSPRTFGSLAPSSPWLCHKMAELGDWNAATAVAELGAGDGVLTRRLLNRLRPGSTLDAYEIQPDLIGKLRQMAESDRRLNVIARSAASMEDDYDLIFSCLPLLSIPVMSRLRILQQCQRRLTPGGTFIQFQYSPLSEKWLSRYFTWTKVYEIRNFPPAWIYVCTPRRSPA